MARANIAAKITRADDRRRAVRGIANRGRSNESATRFAEQCPDEADESAKSRRLTAPSPVAGWLKARIGSGKICKPTFKSDVGAFAGASR